MTTQTKHLTYEQLQQQCLDCHVRLIDFCTLEPGLKTVVIRTETGDHYLAAIHREGEMLIFDLGQKVE